MAISQELANAQKELEQRRKVAGVCYVPPGEERTIADEIDALLERLRHHPNMPQEPIRPAKSAPGDDHEQATVKAYPTIITASYKANLAAVARVYLLMRAMDHEGRGAVDIDHLRDRLTRKTSTWRIVGWRRLRQILAEGEGVFWTRGGGRLWIHSAARIARALDCGRLTGKPVLIPVAALLESIAATKAAFYAAWHAGRRSAEAPIGRAAIREAVGVSETSQRRYEQIIGIDVYTRNLEFENWSGDQEQRRRHAWDHGRGSFVFVDHVGRMGEAGARYLAAQLPNTYTSPFARARRGRQRKVNKRISLVTTPTRGNDANVCRRYYQSGRAAAAAWSHDPRHDRLYVDTTAIDMTVDSVTRLRGVTAWRRFAAVV